MTAPFAVGVCGFGRCGTTMVMEMLWRGGLRPVDGSSAGGHELENLNRLRDLTADDLLGRSVKLLDFIRYGDRLANVPWRFIWLDRDPVEQGRSNVKLMVGAKLDQTGILDTPEGREESALDMAAHFMEDRPTMLAGYRKFGPVTTLDYERILANPAKGAKALAKVWPDLDRKAAAGVVHRRDGTCRPDLATEKLLENRPTLWTPGSPLPEGTRP